MKRRMGSSFESERISDHHHVPVSQEIGQRLRQTWAHSVTVVRTAQERVEAAANRARSARDVMDDLKGVARSITTAPRRDALLQLVAAEADRSARETERFIAVVSHELRQPLNAALAALRVAEVSASQSAVKSAEQIIHRQLFQMSRLLDDLLDLSRLRVSKLTLRSVDVDLRAVVDAAVETISPQADADEIHLDVKVPSEAVVVHGDPSRLQQILTNLLANAVRYTPQDGQVSLSVTADDSKVTIEVTDTGQGIAPEDLGTIFEPFIRGHNNSSEGFGIGLAIVRGLVDLHGGSVTVASPGKASGSTFTITLPASH
jgi:two-component system, chemotaxis family, CheB/CheR fusion protein